MLSNVFIYYIVLGIYLHKQTNMYTIFHSNNHIPEKVARVENHWVLKYGFGLYLLKLI